VLLGDRVLGADETLLGQSGGRTRDSPFKIVFRGQSATFVYNGRKVVRPVYPRKAIIEYEWSLSNEMKDDVEMVLDDFLILSTFPFGDLRTSGSSIKLRRSHRPVYSFDIGGQATFFRFRPEATIREVKSIVMPTQRSCFVSVSFAENDLDEQLSIGQVPGYDRSRSFAVSVKNSLAMTIRDPDKKPLTVTVGSSGSVPLSSVEKLIGQPFEVLQLGAPVAELKYSRQPSYQVRLTTAEYIFDELGGQKTRVVEKAKTFAEYLKAAFPNSADVVLLVDNRPLRSDLTFGTLAPRTTIKVLQLKTRQQRKTIGDTRTWRAIYRSGGRVLVSSVELYRAGDYQEEPAAPGGARKFDFRLPFCPQRWRVSGTRRTLMFDFEATVADATAALSDVTGLSFPPYGLWYRGESLSEKDFMFDIGYERGEEIEVRLVALLPDQLLCCLPDGRDVLVTASGETGIPMLKVLLDEEYKVGTGIDLICAGKELLDTDTVSESGLSRNLRIYVCVRPEAEAGSKKSGSQAEGFHFHIRKTDDSVTLPFDPAKTAQDALLELSSKLTISVNEMALIDPIHGIGLRGRDRLSDYVGRRGFDLLFIDDDRELTQQQIDFLKKQAPGVDDEVAKRLFLECGGVPTIFVKTCKKRGLIQ
jgi:hypothetical protein